MCVLLQGGLGDGHGILASATRLLTGPDAGTQPGAAEHADSESSAGMDAIVGELLEITARVGARGLGSWSSMGACSQVQRRGRSSRVACVLRSVSQAHKWSTYDWRTLADAACRVGNRCLGVPWLGGGGTVC